MRKIICLSLALLIIIVTATGCSNASAEKMYGKDDQDITVGVGDTFSIELEANPTTGYDWTVRIINDNVVSFTGKEYLPEPVDTSIVGSGGVDVITFKALQDGSAIIILNYERSFEKDSSVETLTYIVTVE